MKVVKYICVYILVMYCCIYCEFYKFCKPDGPRPLQRWFWQLGTGQANYSSQSTPKKEMHKIIRIYSGLLPVTQSDG